MQLGARGSMQCGLAQQHGMQARAVSGPPARRINWATSAPNFCAWRARQRPIGLRSSSSSPPQCSASCAAAPAPAGGDARALAPPAAGPPPAAKPPRQLVPRWAARALQVVGAAAAFVVWYQLASALQGPFASLGLAAAAPANEGARA